jgi:succinyl-diaminopimelate desuccinylase
MLCYFAETDKQIKDIVQILFEDKYKIKDFKDETGNLTFSPDVISFENDTLYITCDMRYPSTMDFGDITDILLKFGAPYTIEHWQAPLFNDKNSFLIKTLSKVYKDVTGKDGEPLAIGGGTYARALKNGTAFGPEFPGEPSPIHQPDEFISLERIKLLADIYYKAIKELTK